MAVIKCKMCGGDLDIIEGQSVCECEYCGTRQTVPMLDDEKKMNLFVRANRLRFKSEFDKASGIYESIIADAPEEAEAYWGLVLCKYGIEYVDDPATGKKIPTCHRSSFDSVLQDPDFDLACEYADPIARKVYREEAKQIEEIRKGILEVSSKEEPCDIFICYKETDENGDRTLDSVLAQDIYDALTDKGYRTFFARITLEDKLGQEYEPYIFAALNSAKIMLAVGTDYDYYNAVWVKNEWSRYLKLMVKDNEKHLIPCYKNLDAYDMPEEFAKLQAQDLGKVGAIQDLLRGIEKLLPKHQIVVHETLTTEDQEIDSLVVRISRYLKEKKWKEADEFCEKILDLDIENGEAYFYKLLAELKCSTEEELNNYTETFDSSENYRKAVKFCTKTRREQLEQLNAAIRKKKETEHLEKLYQKGVSLMNSASTAGRYKNAAKQFKAISDYKDSKLLQEKCAQKEKQARNKILRIETIFLASFFVIIVLVFMVSNIGGYYYAKVGNYDMAQKVVFSPEITELFDKNLAAYIDASRHMVVGNYRTANEKFSEISGYLTSEELADEANYRYSQTLLNMNLFDQAKERYTVLAEKGYKDTSSLLIKTDFLKAQSLIEKEDYAAAYDILFNIKDYMDVEGIIQDLKEKLYKEGITEYRKGKIENARLKFNYTKSYKDTEKYISLIDIKNGNYHINGEKYIETLFDLGNFEDAKEILMSNDLFKIYLKGTWKDKNNVEYLTLAENGHIEYNLPNNHYGDSHKIENGLIKAYYKRDRFTTEDLFYVKILDRNSISVYCFKDASLHSLYRQE